VKPSTTLNDSLSTMEAVTTTGDLRRIVANAMLALTRKEISATDFLSLAKGLDAISASLQTEVNIAKTRQMMLQQGGALTRIPADVNLGQLTVGPAESATVRGVEGH